HKPSFLLQILCARILRRGFLLGLTPGFISGTELLFLLINNLASAIYPLICLLAGFIGPFTYVFTAFIRFRTQHFPGFAAGSWCIQNPYCRTNAYARQKPKEAVAISVCHSSSNIYLDGSTRNIELQFRVGL